MNWNKAANLLIICLIILNLALGYMLSLNNRQYILTGEQEDSVKRILLKNEIEVNEIIKNYTPMRAINIAAYMYDNESIKELFLGTSADIKRTTEFNKTKYTRGSETLVISSKMIEYAKEPSNGEKPTIEAAKKTAQGYYKSKLSKKLPGFKLNSVYEKDGTIIVDYRGVYKNNIIYSNYLQFTVDASGIVNIICEYQKPGGYYGDKKQIYSPGEALVSFMYEARKETDEKLTVYKMDMVYHPVESAESGNIDARATPFYRIYVSGRQKPFLINAYTNASHN